MSQILKFPDRGRPRQEPQGWDTEDLQQIENACSGSIANGEASGWEIGITELGDPQVYLIGPPPNYDCLLCISRIGGRYIIEDGTGRVLFEQDSPVLLAEQALSALRRRKTLLLARIGIVWCSFREAIEAKADALASEPMQALAQVAPQLAFLA